MLQCQEPIFCGLWRLSHPSIVSGLAYTCQREMVASSQSWWLLHCYMWICHACNLLHVAYSYIVFINNRMKEMLCVLQSIYVVAVYISDWLPSNSRLWKLSKPGNCSDIADDCSLHRNFRKHLVDNFETMHVARVHVAEFSKVTTDIVLYLGGKLLLAESV